MARPDTRNSSPGAQLTLVETALNAEHDHD